MTPVEPDPNAGLNGAVAGELRAAKARRQSSNERIAEQSGIPLVSVNRYMAGKRPITLVYLEKLADALGMTASEVVAAALAELARGGNVLRPQFGEPSEAASTVDLSTERSAAEPERRDDGSENGDV